MESKINYQKLLDQQLEVIKENIAQGKEKPSLLLHACCGPCSSYVIEYLSNFFKITILYYNPNIHPEEEYQRRLNELKNFLPRFPPAVQNNVKLVELEYNPQDFFEATNVLNEKELQTEAEKGERCRRCYKFRMQKAWEYACKNNFDYFTTTLSISPYKDSKKLNNIGYTFDKIDKTNYLPADFKKKGGFLRSTQISAEYGLWRQDYCGCIYSKQNSKKDF